MTDFIEVEHEGVEGTAKVPASALKHMKGWTRVDDAPATTKKRARLAEHTDNTQES